MPAGCRRDSTEQPAEPDHVTSVTKRLSLSPRLPLDSTTVSAILDTLRDYPAHTFSANEAVMTQGETSGLLFILIDGTAEVVKDEVSVATVSEPGAIFGDLSALLGIPHTATVRAVRESKFHIVKDPRAFLRENPDACVHLCELLARRLDALNNYLVNVKHQFAGHDHIGMVDKVLDTLMHRQPRKRIAPRDSTIRDSEVAD